MHKRCFFAGHSDLYYTDEIREYLKGKIERLIISENVREFWVGGYGRFDSLAAACVRELKKKHTNIELLLVLPYLRKGINKNKEELYKKYDCILIADLPPNTPKSYSILKCNEYMADNSDFLICFVRFTWGGAWKTMEYAKRKKLTVININDEKEFII